MIDMIVQHIIPSLKAGGVGPIAELHKATATLKNAISVRLKY